MLLISPNSYFIAIFSYNKVDVEFAGYKIKKGWSVNLDVVSIHHDPKVFPDPQKFDPSRFDVSSLDST
jgi:cytochrome P450